MAEVSFRNVRERDRISTEIKEMMRDQRESVVLEMVVLSVESLPTECVAVFGKRNLFINPHRVDQSAVASTFLSVGSASSCYPVALLCKFNDVPTRGTKLAFREGAESAKGVRSESQVVIDDVRKQFRHSVGHFARIDVALRIEASVFAIQPFHCFKCLSSAAKGLACRRANKWRRDSFQ
jgi:hypothetical protein